MLELHGLTSTAFYSDYKMKIQLLVKLNRLFHLYHVHGNNNGMVYQDENYLLPDVLEVSYVRKGGEC